NKTLRTNSRFSLSTFPRNILKESNNLLWSILRSIIHINNIHLTFVKVQAHSSNNFNNRVDLLAKLAIQNQEHVLTFLPTNTDNILYFPRSEEHTSELQSLAYLVCRLLLEKKNNK